MREPVLKATEELGISAHVSVKEVADSIDPLVTVAYPPKAVQSRIPAKLLMEENLAQVKIVLTDMANWAKQ